MNLKARIAALESATPPASPPIITRIIVDPKLGLAPMDRLDTGAGIIDRHQDETDEAFRERAARLAGWPGKPVRLITPMPEGWR